MLEDHIHKDRRYIRFLDNDAKLYFQSDNLLRSILQHDKDNIGKYALYIYQLPYHKQDISLAKYQMSFKKEL